MLPILLNHDPKHILGFIDNEFVVHLKTEISKSQFFELFPGAGISIENYKIIEDEMYFKEAKLYDISLIIK
jgi:hypothetical protein